VLSAFGFLLRGWFVNPEIFIVSGIVVGVGSAACSFPVVIAALGKVVALKQRSFVMGLGTAAASLGMFGAAPASTAMIGYFGWQMAISLISISFLAILPFWFCSAGFKPKRVGPRVKRVSSGDNSGF